MYAKDKNVILKNHDKKICGKLLGINEIGELEIKKNNKIINISDTSYSMRVLE